MRGKYKEFFDFKNLRLYMNQISKFPALTQEDEKRLGNLIQKGDNNALKELIE